MTSGGAWLFGVLSLDIYVERGVTLPGGGALNMAWHWRRLGQPFRLLSRIGNDHPDVFLDFLDRHGIPYLPRSIVGDGPSASIDIVIRPDGQPWMDHFVDGVWDGLRLTATEEDEVVAAASLHGVLTEGVIAEYHRLGAAGALATPFVSADFLDFRHYSVTRFAETMRFVDLAFVGWPGDIDDPTVAGIRSVAMDLGRLVVITNGARNVLVADGRRGPGGTPERMLPVEAIPVVGTTVGCGDAFIAGFLASFYGDHRPGAVERAVRAGAAAGALVTAWQRPLPDHAYGPAIEGLRSA